MGKLWENIWFRFIAIIVLSGLFLWLCYTLREILIPLALAFIVAYIFNPLVDYFEHRKIPRSLSIAAILILILGIVGVVLFLVIPRMVSEAGNMVQTFQQGLPDIQKNLQGVISKFSRSPLAARVNSALDTLLGTLQDNIPQVLQATEKLLAGIVTRTVDLVGYIIDFLVFAVVSVYLLRDFHIITAKASDILPTVYRGPVLEVVHKIDVKLRGFFRGQIVVATILTGIYVIGFSIVGTPFALLISFVGGYGQIVPYLGTAISIVPATLLTLIKYKDFIHPLCAVLVFVVGHSLESTIITPRVMGDKIGLHPVAIIIAILAFAKLLGFLGILVAVPLAAVVMVLLTEVMARYKQSSLYSNQTDDDSTSK